MIHFKYRSTYCNTEPKKFILVAEQMTLDALKDLGYHTEVIRKYHRKIQWLFCS